MEEEDTLQWLWLWLEWPECGWSKSLLEVRYCIARKLPHLFHDALRELTESNTQNRHVLTNHELNTMFWDLRGQLVEHMVNIEQVGFCLIYTATTVYN